MSDEREKLPSASSMARYAICPGSYLLEATIDEMKSSEDAAIGNRIHAKLAGERIDLSDDEEELKKKILDQELKFLDDCGWNSCEMVIRERRLWFTGFDFKKEWSGKPDVVYIREKEAIIIDYKTGRGDVEVAVGNLQLRALAVLVHLNFDITKCTVAIIQPLVQSKPSFCVYEKDDLLKAHQQICEIVERIKLPDQPRVPSVDGCKYCKAKGVHCEESREMSIQLPMTNLPDKITPEAVASTLTSAKLGEFLQRAAMAEGIIEACKEEAKRRLSDGDTVPGWKLRPGSIRETITDPDTVFQRFIAAGGTAPLFMSAVNIASGKLKDAFKLATGLKGKELEELIQVSIEGCTETKQTSPVLVKNKE